MADIIADDAEAVSVARRLSERYAGAAISGSWRPGAAAGRAT
jgi:hypothetical protein